MPTHQYHGRCCRGPASERATMVHYSANEWRDQSRRYGGSSITQSPISVSPSPFSRGLSPDLARSVWSGGAGAGSRLGSFVSRWGGFLGMVVLALIDVLLSQQCVYGRGSDAPDRSEHEHQLFNLG